MSIQKVKQFFQKHGMDGKIHEFDVSSATVLLAAEALGCEPARIAKTLAFSAPDKSILIVAAGDAKIDNKKFKEKFHLKAKMMSPEETVQNIGHAVGGVCPFCVNEGVLVYLDVSLKRFETVFPACGSANSAIELGLEQLERFSNCNEWIDVCKSWQ